MQIKTVSTENRCLRAYITGLISGKMMTTSYPNNTADDKNIFVLCKHRIA